MTDDIDLAFHNQPVEIGSSHKHLGITFDSNGTFSTHLDTIMHSVRKKNLNMFYVENI